MTTLSQRRTFSGTALKTIACITMLVDHIGASCIEAGILTPGLDAGTLSQDTLSAYPLYRLDMVLRFTGRLAFPLFCFLLVEGFVHTHNIKGYLGRLVLFGLLSDAPPLTPVRRTFTGRWRWACWPWQGSSALKRKTACPAGRGLCGRAGAPHWRWLPAPTTTPAA